MAFIKLHHFSKVLNMNMQAFIVLPENPRGRLIDENETYRVVYLLHGLSDNQSAWTRRTSLERYAMDKKLIVVMPTTHRGWYTNMHKGFEYFTYIADELPKIVEKLLPQIKKGRENTFVAGLSMGGYGAAMLALKRPDFFSKAFCLSGAYDIDKRLNQAPRHRKAYFASVFGNEVDRENACPYYIAENFKGENKPEFYLYCGTEDLLLEENRKFKAVLEKDGFDLEYIEDKGAHTWEFWDKYIKVAFDKTGGDV